MTNRRNFFSRALGAVGGLVGLGCKPQVKPPKSKPCSQKENNYENDVWYTTTVWIGDKEIQYRHKRYPDDEIIIDWFRSVQKATDT